MVKDQHHVALFLGLQIDSHEAQNDEDTRPREVAHQHAGGGHRHRCRVLGAHQGPTVEDARVSPRMAVLTQISGGLRAEVMSRETLTEIIMKADDLPD